MPPERVVFVGLQGAGKSSFYRARGIVRTAQAVLEELQGVYAYTESDEISVLSPRGWDLFDRELEKVVALSASTAGATLSLAFGMSVHFDSRAIVAAEDDQVTDYFRWRQADAARCALNGWAYRTLRKAGRGVAHATAALGGRSVADKNELLFQAGVNFNDLPLWQRRGTGLYWEWYERAGYNPKLDQQVVTTRRRIKVDQELPMGEEYADLIDRLMRGAASPAAITANQPGRGDS